MKAFFSINPIVCSLLCLLLPVGTVVPIRAQGFREPSIIVYGKVFHSGEGSSFQVFTGQLRITLVNRNNSANSVTLRAALKPTGEDHAYSYVLQIPHKYLPRQTELQEVLTTSGARNSYRIASLTVDGIPASPLDPNFNVFSTTSSARADQVRMDIKTALRLDDTDMDRMPDIWEQTYGLNPFSESDASLDRDGDGLTNLDEFLKGTDPGQSNARPILFTRQLRVTELGRAGLILNVQDSDSPPESITFSLKHISGGFDLLLEDEPIPPGTVFTMADVQAGKLILAQNNASASSGRVDLEFWDEANQVQLASINLLVFRPGLPSDPEIALWLDATQFSTHAEGAAVMDWPDRSGRNHHAWQNSNAANKPLVHFTDGMPGVRFPGIKHHLLLPDAAFPAGDLSFFAVYQADQRTEQQQILAANRFRLSLKPVGPLIAYPGAQVASKENSQIVGRLNVRGESVMTALQFAASSSSFINGRFDAHAEPLTAAQPPVLPALGGLRQAAGPDPLALINPFAGIIQEILVIPSVLAETTTRRISDYLLSKWHGAVIWDAAEEGQNVSIFGGADRNIIRGGWSSDYLRGGPEADLLSGGPGSDRLIGGAGSDVFLYRQGDEGIDVIEDFSANQSEHDVLDLTPLFLNVRGNALEHLNLRFETVRNGDGFDLQSILSVKFTPLSAEPELSIVLKGLALTDADLPALLQNGIILVGNLSLLPASFTEWMLNQISPDADPSMVKAEADFDGDELPNFAEYVFGTNPLDSASVKKVPLEVSSVNGTLIIRFFTSAQITEVNVDLLGGASVHSINQPLNDQFILSKVPQQANQLAYVFQARAAIGHSFPTQFFQVRLSPKNDFGPN